eukprot:6579655-Prymnesium_polylepis.2
MHTNPVSSARGALSVEGTGVSLELPPPLELLPSLEILPSIQLPSCNIRRVAASIALKESWSVGFRDLPVGIRGDGSFDTSGETGAERLAHERSCCCSSV